MKDFNLPLPEQTHELKAEDIRKARDQAIADYAAEVAGTTADLDPALESAAIEHLSRVEWR